MEFVSSFATWIDASKTAGVFRKDIPTNEAVHQIEALHVGASSLQRNGESSVDSGSSDCFHGSRFLDFEISRSHSLICGGDAVIFWARCVNLTPVLQSVWVSLAMNPQSS